MRQSKVSFILIFYILAMFFLPQFSVLLLRDIVGLTDLVKMKVLVNFISYVVLIIVTLGLFGKDLVRDFKDIKSPSHFFQNVFFGWGFLLIASIASNYLLFFITDSTDSSQNQQAIEIILDAHPWLMATTTVLFAPLVEEVIFRLALMKYLFRLTPRLGILLSSFLFGLIHVVSAGDFIFLIPYMAMGIPLGYSYHKTKNICYPIGIHILQNLFATVALILPAFLS